MNRHIVGIYTRVVCRRLVACKQRTISSTSVLLDKRTMKVPGMGDSITEGTIVEWTAAVGQAVKEGDVVALVETDKVTVDIKAEMDGVITRQFGAVDDTVEVGADLYEIDTEAEASALASAADASSPSGETEATKAAAVDEMVSDSTATSIPPNTRTPMILFLGKEGWARRKSGAHQPSSKPQSFIPDKPNGVVVIDGSMLKSSYGRPGFSDDEMEALILGGANVAPSVLSTSSGAIFSPK